MRTRGATVALLVLGALALPCAPAAAQDAPPGVSILGPKEVSFAAATGKDTAEAELQLDNRTGANAQIQLELAAPTLKDVKLDTTTLDVPAGITRQKVTVSGLEEIDKKGSAFLVVKHGEKANVLPVAITNPRKSPRMIVYGTLAAFVLIALWALLVAANAGRLNAPAGNPKWGFDSWATTLTGAGAALTTVVSSATLPEVPQRFDKNTLTELSLVFALLVVVGPFVSKVFRKKPPADEADAKLVAKYGIVNHHWLILVAASLVSAAVLGQLGTLLLLGEELANDGMVRTVVRIGAALLALGAVVYIHSTLIKELAPRDWLAIARKAQKDEDEAFTWVKVKSDDEDEAAKQVETEQRRQLSSVQTGEVPPAEAVATTVAAPQLVWKMP